jgi:hypothetical protein
MINECVSAHETKILKKIEQITTIGTRKPFIFEIQTQAITNDEILESLADKGVYVNKEPKKILEKPNNDTQHDVQPIRLIIISAGDLGFTDEGSSLNEIFDKAIEIGLEHCIPMDGFKFRNEYQDQPIPNSIGIGMKPVEINNCHQILSVSHNTKSFSTLTAENIKPYKDQKVFGSGSQFAFRLPK